MSIALFGMEFDEIVQSRKSVKKFSKEKPDWRKIIEAIDSARYAPMAGNMFTLKFIIVNDKEKIKNISEEAQQDFIKEAQYLVIVCSNPSLILNSYPEKGETYLRQQTGAAIQNFWLKLVELGLSTCWIGYFVETKIKKILNIPESINVEAIFPIGYENKISKPKLKNKIEIDNILFFEKYGNKKMSSANKLFG